jgi:hypothetical protein
MTAPRNCENCRRAIPSSMRASARYCGERCRSNAAAIRQRRNKALAATSKGERA